MSSSHSESGPNVVLRVSRLPLVRSAFQNVTSAYSEAKFRFPLISLFGGVAERGARSVSQVAMTTATPLLKGLEPQIDLANSFAMEGLDRLEKNFPVLNQSTTEVVGHLRDALFLTLDDVQLWAVEGADVLLDRLERVSDSALSAAQLLQDTPIGRAAAVGLDEMVTRLEVATATYMPLPPTLRREWEMRVQEFEEEDDDDEEPSLWTRIRSLLLSLSLQIYHRLMKVKGQLEAGVKALGKAADKLYHRLMKVKGQLEAGVKTLGEAADKVGLGSVLTLVGEMQSFLQSFMMGLIYRTEGLREMAVNGLKGQAMLLAELRPVKLISELPLNIQQIIIDLQELTKLLIQLVINATPLYNMLQQPSAQEVDDFLNRDDFMMSSERATARRSSANSLFMKAMDGRPRRRKSLYSLASRGGGDSQNGRRRSSVKDGDMEQLSLTVPSEGGGGVGGGVGGGARRRSSATDMLLAPLKQFVTQSQKAFEYLSPNMTNTNEEEADGQAD